MDWLAGFGWSGLITVAVSMVWVIFPLNNKLLVCIYTVLLLPGPSLNI